MAPDPLPFRHRFVVSSQKMGAGLPDFASTQAPFRMR
jgi:hypothetical protein